MTGTTNGGTAGDIGVGLISVGWMGKLHSRAYQALPAVYPELGLRPRLLHAADTAPAYLAALQRVRAAAAEHGKACGLLVPDGTAAAAKRAEGWTFVAVGSDATLLAATVTTELARARPSTPDLRGGQT